MPYPLPLTRTEAYLAYKAGVIQQSDLKPSLAVSRNGIDAWLAYWTGLTKKFPIKGITKNLWEWNKYDEYSVTNRTTYEIDGDNNLVVSTTSGSYQNVTFLVELEDGEYTFSLGSVTNTNPSMTVKRMTLATRNSDGSGRTVVQQVSAGTPRTVTITNEPNKIYTLEFWGTDGTSLNNTATYSQVQIEKGDEATSYEPYTGEPEMLTEEEAFIAYLSGVINEYPEKCLRRVGAYLRYLISARWGRPDHPLNREELYLSLIKTQFIPSGDPSSDIVIDGTTKAPFQDVKMYGDTEQKSYTGKNLLSLNNLILGKNNNGEFSIDNTEAARWRTLSTDYAITPIPSGTQLTMSVRETGGTAKGFGYYVRLIASDNSFQDFPVYIPSSSTTGYNTGTITTSFEVVKFRMVLDTNTSESKTANLSVQWQLEKGSTATSFEPYVGGQPSPSPSYPQQIQTVTGEQTVEIHGKNLFDKNNVTENSVLEADGTLSFNTTDYSTSALIPVKPSTTYYKSRTDSVRFKFYDAKQEPTSSVYTDIPTAGNAQSFATPSDCYYVRFTFKKTLANTVQLELGSTSSSYAAYSKQTYTIDLGSIELCKLGTYQDYIWKDGESWKVHKTVGKILLGEFDYSYYSNTIYYITNASAALGINTSTDTQLYSECFTGSRDSQVTNRMFYGSANNRFNIYPDAAFMTTYNTVDKFKKWLNDNSISLYYIVATPTDTTITDTTLIAQLEALLNGGAEDGTTYIKVKATDPNLPGLLYVEAPKYE